MASLHVARQEKPVQPGAANLGQVAPAAVQLHVVSGHCIGRAHLFAAAANLYFLFFLSVCCFARRTCRSPKQLRQAALIRTKGQPGEALTEKAAVCFAALERYLGSKPFMFGTKYVGNPKSLTRCVHVYRTIAHSGWSGQRAVRRNAADTGWRIAHLHDLRAARRIWMRSCTATST